MSNTPVDTGQDNTVEEDTEEQEDIDNHSLTRVSFRIPVDAIMFYKRMAQNFYEGGLIPEPKLALLAKACLNLLARKYAKVEELTMATYVQKRLAEARGPNYVTVPQIQKESGVKKTVEDFIPAKLRRAPPIDTSMPEPEWL